MKNNVLVKIWNVIYPIFIYYVICNVVIYLAMVALQISGANYVIYYTMLQTIATAMALPFLYGFYRKDKLFFTVFHQRTQNGLQETPKKRRILNGVLIFICGALAGVVLNNLIGATGLAERSAGYQEATTHFYAGGIAFEILGLGILIPVVEELLYRGIVYARLADWIGIKKAAVISAFLFGALHFNVVQFIYAFFMGMLLVYFLEKSHHLYGAVAGHIAANLITVLRTETGILEWMGNGTMIYWLSTLGMAVICVAIICFINKKEG